MRKQTGVEIGDRGDRMNQDKNENGRVSISKDEYNRLKRFERDNFYLCTREEYKNALEKLKEDPMFDAIEWLEQEVLSLKADALTSKINF